MASRRKVKEGKERGGRRKRADGGRGERREESERAAGGDFFRAGGIFSDFKSGMCVFSCRAPRFLTVSLLSVGCPPTAFGARCPPSYYSYDGMISCRSSRPCPTVWPGR
ncbi:hypothetical protein BO78DRAFT_72053 [Aspergillus sclerotiicarbonarius CBS 121057]|uniref:Uncharacterized protein n=1 Tax=Aspergillus sclerotiicarbonarius (strain CBS 121057 / IBT 28362) TaxID=1448318 RepID=A0A319FK65_ASPSB|nr:hypothetical protein BO78DRAFT_72053 [Aspergillus sclerotiicarbonarius CBS 121057]